jgi:hypothetical protein
MGPGYFVIAILGCADGGGACVPVATLPHQYASASECSVQTGDVLAENTGFDFPTIMAECRAGTAAQSADTDAPNRLPRSARRS